MKPRVAQPIPRGRAGYLLRLVRGIVWVTESQEVGRKHGSSCDSVTPAFFRKCVLKWRRLLRKKRRGHPRGSTGASSLSPSGSKRRKTTCFAANPQTEKRHRYFCDRACTRRPDEPHFQAACRKWDAANDLLLGRAMPTHVRSGSCWAVQGDFRQVPNAMQVTTPVSRENG